MNISAARLRELSEQAISEGKQLHAQYSRLLEEAALFPLRLDTRVGFGDERAEGFFGHVAIDGETRSAMGCRHRFSIGRDLGPCTIEELRDFAFRNLLSDAGTTKANRQSGFTVRDLFSPAGGSEADPGELHIDWRRLGDTLPWTTLSIELHDFELRLGLIALRPRQIVYVVQHPAFAAEQEHPTSGVVHRITVGYPFVQHAPLRNPFGFGPGKFGAAIKQFSFSLRTDRTLEVDMLFLAAPRCQKVIDVLGLPDPIFGSLGLLETLSFGALQAKPYRNRIEALMLETHCRVHGALLEGFVRRWKMEDSALRKVA